MKTKTVRFGIVLIVGMLLFGGLTGCGSKGTTDTKEQLNSSTDKKGKDIIKGFYVDEATGEIIDASTGEAVTDGSVKVDEKTGDIVDTATGEVIETKAEAEEVKKKVIAKANSNKKENKKEEKKEEKKEDEKQESQASKETTKDKSSDKKDNSGNKDKTATANSKAPTSNKKVSFNKDRLYQKMVATYKVPDYYKEPTRKEFIREVDGQIPAKVQKIFNWYFDILDTGKATEITVSDEEYQLFKQTLDQGILYYSMRYGVYDEGKGIKKLVADATEANNLLDQAYSNYCNQIKEANAPAKAQYEEYIAKAKKACDLIEKAVKAADIQGKDEVTAVNNIINYICKNCTYWNEAVNMKPEEHNGEWICDCLEDHHAVCNGYSKTFYAMCYYAGIDVTYYWGYTDDGGAHAWDSVKVNGKDYYFDVTWHDSILESGSTKDAYIWAGNAEFSKEHMKKGTDISFW